ncbi:MAG: methyltransferase domain-containing protein, partial [Acidimicrobiales bacterium]|nr:methyltransferase domain-containing protein [Acidimicrobiales bacterium]
GLAGTVVEIGFGSGHNVPIYPDEVTEVLAVEPSERARELAAARIDERGLPVTHVGLDGQRLPLDDDSCDGALSTFTLCTIPDVDAALAELRRVLRPGGRLHVLEHGISPDPGVARWQRRLDPIQQRLADGCHLTRDPVALLEGAGFEVASVTSRYGKGPKPWTWMTTAVAISA